MSITGIFCILGQSDPGKVTQQLISPLTENQNKILMRKSNIEFGNV